MGVPLVIIQFNRIVHYKHYKSTILDTPIYGNLHKHQKNHPAIGVPLFKETPIEFHDFSQLNLRSGEFPARCSRRRPMKNSPSSPIIGHTDIKLTIVGKYIEIKYNI